MIGRTVLVAAGGDLTAELPLEVYPVPATITLLAGDGQHAPAGHRLPAPLRAQIVSRGGRPLAGVAVRVGAADDTGRGEQVTDTSDADGIVQMPGAVPPGAAEAPPDPGAGTVTRRTVHDIEADSRHVSE